jgi:tRNA threonylcarbamoyladenosine biosynthesis protein TsaB
MNLLAFDTCFGTCSVAVRWQEGATSGAGGLLPPPLLISRNEQISIGHAERLLPMIGEVMREFGRGFEALDAIVVTEGPGTFTGVRVGVAAARGLALATSLPIRATTSLHVIAHQALRMLADAASGRVLAVAIDARAGQVFLQTFSDDGGILMPAGLMTPEEAVAHCAGADVVCVGSGGPAVASAARRVGRAADALLPNLQPDARVLLELAPGLRERKPLHPLYLRLPDAKPQSGKGLPRL